MKEASSSAPATETTTSSGPGIAPPASAATGRTARATVVLGVDPGTRCLGYGAIVLAARGPRLLAAGVVRATHADVPSRLGHLRRELDRLFERLAPDVIVVEQAFAARNVQSALRIGEGRGVVLCCAAHAGARIVQYAPAVAKKALVGNGSADKTQVARMVEHLLGRKSADLPIDASDALALALCHAQRAALERLCPTRVPVARRPASNAASLPGVPAPRRRRAMR